VEAKRSGSERPDAAALDSPLYSDFADDADMQPIISEFVDELADRVRTLQDAADHNDLGALQTIAHQLKGAAGGYGFGPITDAARHLEASTAARAELTALGHQVAELVDLCRRATSAPPSRAPRR